MPDFSILQTPNFAQAALGGYQAGQEIGRQRRSEAALKGYIDNPDDPAALSGLITANPELGLRERARLEQRAKQTRIGDLARRAAAGDHDAAVELWSEDSDLASKFDARTQDQLKQGTEAVGNAAVRIALLPDNEIPAAADQAIDALAGTFPNLARFKGAIKTRADLDAILDQTGMTQKVIELRSPKYQAIVPGGRMENTNPYANVSGQPRGGDPSSGGGGVPPEAVEYLRQNPSLKSQFDQKYGQGAADQVLGGAPSQGGAPF